MLLMLNQCSLIPDLGSVIVTFVSGNNFPNLVNPLLFNNPVGHLISPSALAPRMCRSLVRFSLGFCSEVRLHFLSLLKFLLNLS